MKNEDMYRKEILELLKGHLVRETDPSSISELFEKLFFAENNEVNNEDIIKKILNDE